MKNISKYRVDLSIVLCIILFATISIVTIGSAEQLLIESSNLVLKQIIWYVIGFIFRINDFLAAVQAVVAG